MGRPLFFHAGCPVCLSTRRQVLRAPEPERPRVEGVPPAEQKTRIAGAAALGVGFMPAPVLDHQALHGASLADLK